MLWKNEIKKTQKNMQKNMQTYYKGFASDE
jgi:hypothetical protein